MTDFGTDRPAAAAGPAIETALEDLCRMCDQLGDGPAAPPAALAQVLALAMNAAGRRGPGMAGGAVRVCAPAEVPGLVFERLLLAGCEDPPATAALPVGLLDDASWAALARAARWPLAPERRRAEERSLFSAAVGAARGPLLLVAAPPEGGEAHPFAQDLLSSVGGSWCAAPSGLSAAADAATLAAAAVAGAPQDPLARAVIEAAVAQDLLARAGRVRARSLAGGTADGQLSPAVAARLAAFLERKGHWSPTALEEYARCPFLFLARRGLGLGRDDPPGLDVPPLEEGGLLHRALQHFLAERKERGALPLRGTDEERALARAAAQAAFDEAAAEGRTGDPRVAPARREELARMLERFVLAEPAAGDGFVPAAFELPFEELAAGGVRLAGFVDRIDLSPDGVRVVDYKRGSDVTGRHKSLADAAGEPGVAFQLPAYLAAAERWARDAGVPVMRRRAAYLALKSPSWIEATPFDGPEGGARLKAALDQGVASVVAGVRAGRFPAAPRERCSGCDQAPVCRYRGEQMEGA